MDLVCQYGTDSDEEDTSPSDELPCKAKKMRLPVPTQIQAMFKENDATSDDEGRGGGEPKKRKQAVDRHQDRIRSFPHVRGNWATCLFAELKRPLLDDLAVLQERLYQAVNDETVKIQPEIHLSLSRTVAFPLHWIELFLRKITKEIGEYY